MTDTDRPVLLAGIDLETTGSDETKDLIIEAALIICNGQAPYDEVARWSGVIAPQTENWSMPAKVIEMHTRNGLLADLFCPPGTPGVFSLEGAEREMVKTLGQLGKPHEFALFGSGVAHFDRRFIAAHMPKLDRWFRYWVIDVGVLRRSLRSMGLTGLVESTPAPSADKTHRAIADIAGHFAELRHYAVNLTSGTDDVLVPTDQDGHRVPIRSGLSAPDPVTNPLVARVVADPDA